jgi:hypothetical protein
MRRVDALQRSTPANAAVLLGTPVFARRAGCGAPATPDAERSPIPAVGHRRGEPENPREHCVPGCFRRVGREVVRVGHRAPSLPLDGAKNLKWRRDMADEKRYGKPVLERLGTLRELTLAGALGLGDGATICGAPCECVVQGRS